MAQGWNIDATADTITFLEPPPSGTNNVQVREFATGAVGGTDVWAVGAWSYRYGYPCEVEFYADRLWFARTRSDPQTVWSSEIGNYVNFGKSSPIVDSDAVSFTINARQVQAIQDLLPLDNMLVLTSGQEWKMTAGQDDAVTPSNVGMKAQSNNGAADVPACIIGESGVFIQKQGSKVRDFRYTFEKDGFRGTEISVWADHLVEGFTFSKIEFASAPWPVLWFVRNDGQLIGCTYMPEQEIAGWHRHDTDGRFLDVCCLPGEQETQVYGLVERTVDGVTEQFIEQMAPTRYADQADYFYLDSGLTFDGRNRGDTTLTLTTADNWTENGALTLTASDPIFVGASDVGDGFKLKLGDESVRVVITGYLTPTTVEVSSIGEVPAELRGQPTADWTINRDTISGLWHLEGVEVVVLADGNTHPRRIVENGAISLQNPSGVVHIGRAFRGHIETLDVNAPGGEPIRGKEKATYAAELLVKETRGVLSGDSLDRLYAFPTREFENYDEPTRASNGAIEVKIDSRWGKDNGRIHVVSDDPLPMEILSITIDASVSV